MKLPLLILAALYLFALPTDSQQPFLGQFGFAIAYLIDKQARYTMEI